MKNDFKVDSDNLRRAAKDGRTLFFISSIIGFSWVTLNSSLILWLVAASFLFSFLIISLNEIIKEENKYLLIIFNMLAIIAIIAAYVYIPGSGGALERKINLFSPMLMSIGLYGFLLIRKGG